MRSSALFNITNVIYMTTSRYRRLNILITMLMVIAFFIETLVSRLYVWVNIFLVCRIHSHHPIFSLKGEFWAHKTNLILPPLFIGSACTKQGKWAVIYLCIRGIDFASFYDLSIRFWNCYYNVIYFSHFIRIIYDVLHNNKRILQCNLKYWITHNHNPNGQS